MLIAIQIANWHTIFLFTQEAFVNLYCSTAVKMLKRFYVIVYVILQKIQNCLTLGVQRSARLWHQMFLGLDQTKELTQKEKTKRHSMTLGLESLREQIKADKETVMFLALLDHNQKKIALDNAKSIYDQLMTEARLLMQHGIELNNSHMTHTAGAMMVSAMKEATEIVKHQSLGSAPSRTPFSLPFDSF